MFTTDNARHSPEIAYLEHCVNGFILKDDPKVYAEEVAGLLQNVSRLAVIREAALDAANKYTLNRMVSNFVAGIEGCFKPG